MKWITRVVGRRPLFNYPVPPAPRTAILVAVFRPKGNCQVFANGWNAEAENFAPASIACSVDQIEALCSGRPPVLTHAVVILRGLKDRSLEDALRDRIWTAFRVPVFEQIVSESGVLLAEECEAHDGLHITAAWPKREGRELDQEACGCGQKSPRLIGVKREREQHQAAAGVR